MVANVCFFFFFFVFEKPWEQPLVSMAMAAVMLAVVLRLGAYHDSSQLHSHRKSKPRRHQIVNIHRASVASGLLSLHGSTLCSTVYLWKQRSVIRSVPR
ncbi:hypothetical protein INR49_004756, partial [Caranx melampygus]